MKKFLITLIVIVGIAVAVLYFASSYFFDYAAEKAMPRLLPQLAARGIHVNDYSYSSIKFTSPQVITAYDVSSSFALKMPNQDNATFSGTFYAKKVNFHIANVRNPSVYLSSDNFFLEVDRADFPGTTFGRFENGYVKLRDPILLSDPRSGLKSMLEKVSDLFNENEVNPNIVIRALVTLNVRGKDAQADLYTVRGEQGTVLRFEEQDIRNMADTFELELSPEEVAIIARYPIRAPIIMRITSDAKDTSRDAHRRDDSVPEDAYRHVLWSYLLTKKFGSEFAEIVTDAHETLPTNTAAERRMDFHNNRIGRGYAQRGIRRERILWLVKNDVNVIRYP